MRSGGAAHPGGMNGGGCGLAGPISSSGYDLVEQRFMRDPQFVNLMRDAEGKAFLCLQGGFSGMQDPSLI